MDLDKLHEPWRDGEESTRLCRACDDLEFNVLLPGWYWSVFDRLEAEGWNMKRCLEACWESSLEYLESDWPPIEGGRYEIFRRYLREAILLYEDGRDAIEKGRANDNMEHKSYLWSGRLGRLGKVST